ncbi:MAG: hypothetical protein U9R42_13010 [Bacteroidota bacterium]|nr:hypothetical protein [Bacteroidota bacterium]
MRKLKNYIKPLIFGIIILTITGNSCQNGYEMCTWEMETTDMNVYLGKMENPTSYDLTTHIDKLDYCKYNLLRISFKFDSKYLSHEFCSTPRDSLVGRIEDILLICNNDYNELYKTGDTLNSIIDIIYRKTNGMMTKSRLSLESYLSIKPICTFHAYLFLNHPPDTTSIQSFKLFYKETDGTTFTDTTETIYITP